MNFADLPEKIRVFVTHEPIAVLIILFSIGLLVRQVIQKKYGIHFKILFTELIVQFGGLVMILKHFEIRYFLPVYLTLIVNLILIFELLNLTEKVKKVSVFSFIIVSFSFAFYQIHDENSSFAELYSPAETIVNKNCINVYSEGCYSQEYALKFGDIFSNNANAETLEKLYGKQYFFIIWEQQLYDWKHALKFEKLFEMNK